MPTTTEDLLALFDASNHELRIFMNVVVNVLSDHPELSKPNSEIVHSHKARIKNRDHLVRKIERKIAEGRSITVDNFFSEITDLAGVRILHLFQENFRDIHRVVMSRVHQGDWSLFEDPKAYTWDPESARFFNELGVRVSEKPSAYTSVHYVLKPRPDSKICCELQVRTLFEEIWGEVDHKLNYPEPNENIACREQILVLSKVVGAGSRLLDSISRLSALQAASRDDSKHEQP
jgi:ppGpp synthetase/RelA/SpoT-type nucleotidyltranferase